MRNLAFARLLTPEDVRTVNAMIDESFHRGCIVGAAIVAWGCAVQGMWRDRHRRIFEARRGNWYCVECGARQDRDPVGRDDVWHLDNCKLS